MTPSIGRKTLLLTGAAGRLGGAILNLLERDAEVIAITHQKPLEFPSLDTDGFDAAAGRHERRAVRVLTCDLTSQANVRATLEAVVGLGHRIDYVVNSAADTRFLGPVTDAMILADQIKRQFELNFLAPALLCSMLFHLQWKNNPIAKQSVSILNISSLSGINVYEDANQGFYASSKAALNMLTLHMASEYGKYGIRVNALAPNSFPENIETAEVAKAAIGILAGNFTGKIAKIG